MTTTSLDSWEVVYAYPPEGCVTSWAGICRRRLLLEAEQEAIALDRAVERQCRGGPVSVERAQATLRALQAGELRR